MTVEGYLCFWAEIEGGPLFARKMNGRIGKIGIPENFFYSLP